MPGNLSSSFCWIYQGGSICSGNCPGQSDGGLTFEKFYGVATISRVLKTVGLFCKNALEKRRYSAKETYNFKEPTNRSHTIVDWLLRNSTWGIGGVIVGEKK